MAGKRGNGFSHSTTPLATRIAHLAKGLGGASMLATHVGMSRTTIFDYLNDHRPIPPLALNRIAVAYPCSLQWLVNGEGDPPPIPSPLTIVKCAATATPIRPLKKRTLKVAPAATPTASITPLEVTPCRTITWKDHTYLRMEDVVELLDTFGASEETDVRNRLKSLTVNLKNMKPLT